MWKILIADDSNVNLNLLSAMIKKDSYHQVISASNGQQAIELALLHLPDVILLDVMMPVVNGYEACHQLKRDLRTSYIPIIFVTAINDKEDRAYGLSVGADDFLTKPINYKQLEARIKVLARSKVLMDELKLHGQISASISGILEQDLMSYAQKVEECKVLILAQEGSTRSEDLPEILRPSFKVVDLMIKKEGQPIPRSGYDIIILDFERPTESFQTSAQIKNIDYYRYTPVIIVLEEEEINLFNEAIEAGVNDYIVPPFEECEVISRATLHARRKRYQDALRINLSKNINFALTDPLTGAYNRRYLDIYLGRALEEKRQIAIILLDIDHFKQINDTLGHHGGDEALIQLTSVITKTLRASDTFFRLGGEEFLIVFSNIALEHAQKAASRICNLIKSEDFKLAGRSQKITISAGVTDLRDGDTIESVVERADNLMYQAKREGRDRVICG